MTGKQNTTTLQHNKCTLSEFERLKFSNMARYYFSGFQISTFMLCLNMSVLWYIIMSGGLVEWGKEREIEIEGNVLVHLLPKII